MSEEKMVYEVCPECGVENGIVWDVEDAGYQAYCPHCGVVLMLCSMCDGSPCDWKEGVGCKHSKRATEEG